MLPKSLSSFKESKITCSQCSNGPEFPLNQLGFFVCAHSKFFRCGGTKCNYVLCIESALKESDSPIFASSIYLPFVPDEIMLEKQLVTLPTHDNKQIEEDVMTLNAIPSTN